MNPEKLSAESLEGEPFKDIDLHDVPNWHIEPGTPLWDFDRDPPSAAVINHEDTPVELPEEVLALRRIFEQRVQEKETMFNGPLANVESLSITPDNQINITTRPTDYFTYTAAVYHHRDNQGENPIRPLGIQATIFSPDGEKIILERKPSTVAEFPEQLYSTGASAKPGMQPGEDMLHVLQKKLKLGIEPAQVRLTGLARSNTINNYCLLYEVRLTPEQYGQGRTMAQQAMKASDRRFYPIAVDEAAQSIERIYGGKRDISHWDPNTYFNLLYALRAEGRRTPEQLKVIMAAGMAKTREHPVQYRYAIEKYLGPDETS